MTPLSQPVATDERAQELRAVIRTLWPDRDDATVMSELVARVAELRRIEKGVIDG